jgi:hypothetical protein
MFLRDVGLGSEAKRFNGLTVEVQRKLTSTAQSINGQNRCREMAASHPEPDMRAGERWEELNGVLSSYCRTWSETERRAFTATGQIRTLEGDPSAGPHA